MSVSQNRYGKIIVAAAAVGAALFAGAQAQADIPEFRMRWYASLDENTPFTYDPAEFGEVFDRGDGTYSYLGGLQGKLWTIDWDVLVDPDPLVDAQIIVTNNADEFQIFELLMTLPVEALPVSIINGSVSATVTNEFNLEEGAILRALRDGSIYAAFVDDPMAKGDPVRTLMDDPFSLETDPIPFDTASATEFFGPEDGPAITDSIQILLRFELSPGDSASINGFFEALAPGPGALGAFAIFGLGLGRRRRR